MLQFLHRIKKKVTWTQNTVLTKANGSKVATFINSTAAGPKRLREHKILLSRSNHSSNTVLHPTTLTSSSCKVLALKYSGVELMKFSGNRNILCESHGLGDMFRTFSN